MTFCVKICSSTLVLARIAIDQNGALLERRERLAMPLDARIDTLIVMSGAPWNATHGEQDIDCPINVIRSECNVLNALTRNTRAGILDLLLSSCDSLIGIRIFPQGLVIARDSRPVCLPSCQSSGSA